MIWHDKLKNVPPEKVAYISDALVIDGIKYPCENPRLEFARALSCYSEPEEGFPGFGFERDENGVPVRIPHLGNVVIGNNVEIGRGSYIDRAVIGSTVIGDNVKIDNLVHIAHGANIGNNTMIAAGAVVCGSVVIGSGCFIGVNSCIKQKVKIGNNVIVGMGAVVLHDVDDGCVVAGNPAKIIRKPGEYVTPKAMARKV